MSGILNSNPVLNWCLVVAGTGFLQADNLTLVDQARLSGTVRSINPSGVIELSSELSPEPLLLKPGTVKKMDFSLPPIDQIQGSTLIELLNGDLLPVSLETMDHEFLEVSTMDAGRMKIPRANLKSMHLGVRLRQPIYSGPKRIDDWARRSDETAGWSYTNDTLLANGPAASSKMFELPKKFVIKFTLKWQGNPSYIIYFADPLNNDASPADRYYMQLGTAGIEVKRESSSGKRFQTIILLDRELDEFAGEQVEVELRVDRKASRIHLFLNGEQEGAGVDPNNAPPVGQGVCFVNQAQPGLNQEIRRIEILEFDNTRARHLGENRGDVALDSLISREEDRWSGHLTEIRKGPDGPIFSFKSDFQEDPLELAESDVSTIFFATRKEAAPDPAVAPTFTLRMRGQGTLKVASCIFSEDSITASHALLGDLKIKRSGVSSLELLESNPAPASDEEPEE